MKKVIFSCPDDLHGRLQEVAVDTGLGVQGVMLLTLRRAAGMPGSAGNFGLLTAPRKRSASGDSTGENKPCEGDRGTEEETVSDQEISTSAGKPSQNGRQEQPDGTSTDVPFHSSESGDSAQVSAGDGVQGRTNATRASSEAKCEPMSETNTEPVTKAPVEFSGQVSQAAVRSSSDSKENDAREGTPETIASAVKEPISEGSRQQPKAVSDPESRGARSDSKSLDQQVRRQTSTVPGQGQTSSGQKGR